MAWYKTGTADFVNGSTAVVGHGTAWIANAAAGEAIYCPDGKFREIASVNSDTSLTLAEPYNGATLAGQSYTILPSQSFIRDLVAQVAALINNYASIANNAGAGKFGDGTLGAPGISFVNDTNTGIRRTADGTFALVSNGVDVATIGPSGMVLVTPNIGAATGTSLALSGALSAGAASATSVTVAGKVETTGSSQPRIVARATSTYSALVELIRGADGSESGFKFALDGVTNNLGISRFIGGGSAGVLSFANATGVADFSANVSIGGASGTNHSAYTEYSGGAGRSSLLMSNGTPQTNLCANIKYDATTGWTYVLGSTPATLYQQSGGGHYWFTAAGGSGAISLSQKFAVDPNGTVLAGVTSGSYHTLSRNEGGNYSVGIFNQSASTPYGLYIGLNGTSGGGGGFLTCADLGGNKLLIAGNGNVTNTNNSYGAISDPDLKDNIVRAGSQWDDVKELARNVCKFSLKSDPEKVMQIGFVSRDVGDIKGVRSISPGLVYATENYEEVVVEPARTEIKIVQRQATQKVTVEQLTPTLVDGRYVLLTVPTEVDVLVIEEHPLFAEDGSPIMEIVEPEQLAVTDAEGNVVTPAKPAVTRQAMHRVPVMEDVEEAVEIPAKIERRLTGTKTDGVNYSIAEMKAFKALGEALERIEVLEAEVAAIKGV